MRAKTFLLIFFVLLMGVSGPVGANNGDDTASNAVNLRLSRATTEEDPQQTGSKFAQGLQNARDWTGVAYTNYLFAAKIIEPTITILARGLGAANYKEYADFLTGALTVAKGAGELLHWSNMLLGLAVNQL